MVDFALQSQMTDALTVPRGSLSSTVIGMAHFAKTGPATATCGQCEFWATNGAKKMICEKYRQMTGDDRKAIPVSTPACRHFEVRQK